jgi:hypothetical protein
MQEHACLIVYQPFCFTSFWQVFLQGLPRDFADVIWHIAYKNVPFYPTNRGYGVFFDHSDMLLYEIQNKKLAKVQVSM